MLTKVLALLNKVLGLLNKVLGLLTKVLALLTKALGLLTKVLGLLTNDRTYCLLAQNFSIAPIESSKILSWRCLKISKICFKKAAGSPDEAIL
ncbi:hypothetical protein H6H03_24650 [Nostoc paludosum FACHB-159]|uniref:Uncharacterized protein n=1 Tax=Nostoc paludosum FACHB-159 TaxID=2692908 RepID=A0ABR8KDY9_9NOSO|nr:hypothetical protein [Nostoc paludosum FACHB-159]